MLIIPGRFCFAFTPGEKHPVESTAEASDDETLELVTLGTGEGHTRSSEILAKGKDDDTL